MYNRVIEEYVENGWVRLLIEEELKYDVKVVYYLFYYGVYRLDKLSILFRVVFDFVC